MRQQALLDALWRALPLANVPGLGRVSRDALAWLPDQGLAHDHIRLGDTGLLARLPKQSQWKHDPEANLRYQVACFEACSISGVTPRLLGWLPVGAGLPFGALLVEFIAGRRVDLPGDLATIATCLADLHASPLGHAASALADQSDLFEANRAEIDGQLAYMDRLPLATPARTALEALRRQLEASAPRGSSALGATSAVRQLIANDTHPGNYVLRDGRAILVDLEKAALGNPGIDLAHATAYTSTTWEPRGAAALDVGQVRRFYAHYLSLVGPERAERLRPWLMPTRRLLYLRALSWCVMWLCELESSQSGWSQDRSHSATVAHFQARARHFLQPETLARIIRELADLDESLCP